MMTIPMNRLAMTCVSAIAVAGCSAHRAEHDRAQAHQTSAVHHVHRVDTSAVDRATAMCEVAALTGRRDALQGEVQAHRQELATATDAASRRTLELIAVFETDLDAAYRFATASCRTFNRCLEENDFQEDTCNRSAALWANGQIRFQGLSEGLAEVRERIATGCTQCSTRTSQASAQPSERHQAHRNHSDDLIGSVFSTDGH